MVALTAPRVVSEKAGVTSTAPVAADVVIYGGAVTVSEGGLAKPGKTGLGLIVLGIADATSLAGGALGTGLGAAVNALGGTSALGSAVAVGSTEARALRSFR